MKTIRRDDIQVDDVLKLYDDETSIQMKTVIKDIEKLTHETPSVWGDAIIGFGNMTYSNTYLKNQPFFNIGIKKTKAGYSLYLNAYDENLYQLADTLKIKHGMGCYYLKQQDIQSKAYQDLILLSIKHKDTKDQ